MTQEHDDAVAAFLAVLHAVSPTQWHAPRADGKWTVAQECVHVAMAYEYGVVAVEQGTAMRLRVPWAFAWISGKVLLPLFLATQTFPRGAQSPAELVPPTVDPASTPAMVADRLTRAAADARRVLLERAPRHPARRVVHAYFGPLRPHMALRLLTAHTRHHLQQLQRRLAVTP